jgi:hypothetical protein
MAPRHDDGGLGLRAPRRIAAQGRACDDFVTLVTGGRGSLNLLLRGLVMGALLAVAACRDQNPKTACTPGEKVACACDAGPYGVRVCSMEGAVGICDCSSTSLCIPGTSVSCNCVGGGVGASVCATDRAYAPCQCVPDLRCQPGASMGCSCATGQNGARVCGADNIYGTCRCEPQELATGVLDFPDPTDQIATHANHGLFWQDDVDLGSYFYWDAWVAPRTSGYLISDGAGGAHAILWGPVVLDGHLLFQGDVWDGTTTISFGAGEGPVPGEWGYHALAMAPDPRHGNALTIFAFWNGICVGMTRFGPVTRHSSNAGNGAGSLLVMGSTHQNLGGRLAAVRGWDNSWPSGPPSRENPSWAFTPERVFPLTSATSTVDFLAEYTRPSIQIPDLSPVGYSGGGGGAPRKHPGRLANAIVTNQMSNDQGFFGTLAPIGPLPTWKSDPDCPYGPAADVGSTRSPPPEPIKPPVQALVFDSFARIDQNFVWQAVPSLGKTESGSLSPLSWNTATIAAPTVTAPFGLITGRAVYLERQPGLAWVDARTINQDVRVQRIQIRWEYGTTGLAFRVVNARTWSYLFVDQEKIAPGVPPPLTAGSFIDGVPGPVTTIVPPDDAWPYMRVMAIDSTITVYVGDGSTSWVPVATLENRPPPANATGVGLAGATTSADASSLWRAESFTMCAPFKCP